MEAAAPEVITISDSEDEEEIYLKICYPNSSPNSIELPLADDGKLLLADIQALKPNIFALNLITDKLSRLLKPKNGWFKEPKEKWSSFRVVAVLKDSANDSSSTTASSSNNNILTLTVSSDELQLPTVSTADDTSINKEPNTSTAVSIANELSQAYGTSSRNKNAVATNERNTVPPPQPIDPSLPSSSLNSNITSFNTSQSLSSSHGNITDAEIFKAYKISSFFELRELLCQENTKYYDCYTIIFNHLKRTLVTHPEKEIVKLLYYAYRSWFDLQTLDSNAPDTCDICDLSLTISHVVSKGHIIKYQSKNNKDPPEISLILDFKNRAHIITYSLLVKNGESPFNFFINKFYPKIQFETFKDNLVYRIITAQLELPFNDPLLFEKLICLIQNVHRHSSLKENLPESYFCYTCNKDLQNKNSIVCHTFTEHHLRAALTQNQLDKLIDAVSIIDYSNNGLFYKSMNESRKRNHQESTSVTASKRQRKD